MSASRAAVAAVMEALDCERDVAHDGTPYCLAHHTRWLSDVNACPRAERTANAAVGADRASIQAETLREAAKAIRARTTAGNADVGPNGRQLERRAIANMLSVKAWDVLGNRIKEGSQ